MPKEYNYDDLYDMILGKKYNSNKAITKPVICQSVDLYKVNNFITNDNFYSKIYTSTDCAEFMLKVCPDLTSILNIKRVNFIEAFYALKLNGDYYENVSTKLQYYIKAAYEAAHKIPNLIFKFLPLEVIKDITTKGYLPEDITLREVIQEMCNTEYKPVCSINPMNRMSSFTEVYIKSNDMVVAVSNDIADKIPSSSVNDLEVDANGVHINGVYLRTLGDYVGYVNSVYDLRNVL